MRPSAITAVFLFIFVPTGTLALFERVQQAKESLRGPKGEKGDRGDKGVSLAGPPGPAGEDGADAEPAQNISKIIEAVHQLQQQVDEIKNALMKPLETPKKSCPTGYLKFDQTDRCFHLSSSPQTWQNARKQCQSDGGDLASFETLQEYNFVVNLIKSTPNWDSFVWIGLNDIAKEGSWVWSDNSPVNFLNWVAGQPDNGGSGGGNEDCSHILARPRDGDARFFWNDLPCGSTQSVVCKI
eukprot:m.19977 g.19977  ORF g.19977 m.19977 type:complete len:240 (+) comp27937_c0_seq2:177-896(+)